MSDESKTGDPLYRMLPHYTIENKQILFLGRLQIGMTVTANIERLLNNQSLQEKPLDVKETSIMQRLINEGIVTIQSEFPTTREPKPPILFVQPHSDDCALSCGAVMAAMREHSVHCETVFSNYAADAFPWRDKITVDDAEYSSLRRMEDEQAIGYLNGNVRFAGFSEAPLRGFKSPIGKGGLFNKDKPLVKEIEARLERTIEQIKPKKVFFPMAIGCHYDHVAVAASVRYLMLNHGKTIDFFFYEDYPYSDENRRNLWVRLDVVAQDFTLIPVYYDIGDFLSSQANLINCYKTQFPKWNLQIIKKNIIGLSRSLVLENNRLSQQKLHYQHAQRVWNISFN